MEYLSLDDVKGWMAHDDLPDYRVDFDSDSPAQWVGGVPSAVQGSVDDLNKQLEGEGFKVIAILFERT